MEEKEKNEAVAEEEDEILDPDDFEDEELEDEEDEGEVDESEEEDETQENSSEAEDEKKKEEEKAKNAKAAQKRRREEARERAKKERLERERKIREDAKLEGELGMMKVNPYTEEPIEDAEDLKIYKLQKELEDEGKDPINDLPKKIADNARKEARAAKEAAERSTKEEEERQKRINAEIKELKTKYPKLNTAELANDPLFKKCLDGRAGRWTQVEIYELYLSEKAKEQQNKEEQKNKEIADNIAHKAEKNPNSSSKGGSTNNNLDEMSDEEFETYFKEKYNS